MDSIADMLIQDMRDLFGSDQKRIDHALAVLGCADHIRSVEGGDPLVIQAAAILHDIGIQAAERKYGSSAGQYQETEGPPIAEKVLRRRGVDEDRIAHVCRIVANHHSARDIDTLEFRVLWDADWLVNLPEMFQESSDTGLEARIQKIFKTNTGRETALRLFVGS
jgi:HD superfamily phosphodiesterase